MVNKKNVSFVRKLRLENGDLNLLATFFLGGGMKKGEWPRRQIRKIRFKTSKLVGQLKYIYFK